MANRMVFSAVIGFFFCASTVLGGVIPTIQYSSTDLGNGLTGWTFSIRCDDGNLGSYAVTLLFEGTGGATIQQVDAFGGLVAVNSESDANAYQGKGVPAYQKSLDSWAFSPFGDNEIPGIHPRTNKIISGFEVGANSYLMSLGSGPNASLGGNTPVAYIVANGLVAWEGLLSRGTSSVATSGITLDLAIPGDYNGDGYVDLADYTVWADHYGLSGAGDGNNDGVVDLADYTIWADNFGQGTPSMRVPEPATMTLLGLGAAALLKRRK